MGASLHGFLFCAGFRRRELDQLGVQGFGDKPQFTQPQMSAMNLQIHPGQGHKLKSGLLEAAFGHEAFSVKYHSRH
ncbi:hypothetical protein DESUT3_35280 [Desulfuromonas versatilis]|uniref:Uncharacterized protein n=1 Tax=Desulfuromonas versatilis TaxID=2802975 RepID=A0ABM8I0C4_9BACT|nr:hypothetical protein DESUT3_35280 [Desulfuromonas versatilis]